MAAYRDGNFGWKENVENDFELYRTSHKTFLIFLVVAAIPLIALLVSTPTLLPWESISIPYLPTFHVIATMAPWVGSIMYHMFMNHCSGYPVYKAVLTIDVLGIWTTQTTGTVNDFSLRQLNSGQGLIFYTL